MASVTEVFAGLAVTDLDTSLDWYVRLFGGSPDLVPNATEAAWQLVGTGWVYVVVDADRAGSGLLTLLVDDLDDCVAGIERRGIATGAIETIPNAVRTVTIHDPDGNRIQFGQPLGARDG